MVRRGTDPDNSVALALQRRQGVKTQADVAAELTRMQALSAQGDIPDNFPTPVTFANGATVEGLTLLRSSDRFALRLEQEDGTGIFQVSAPDVATTEVGLPEAKTVNLINGVSLSFWSDEFITLTGQILGTGYAQFTSLVIGEYVITVVGGQLAFQYNAGGATSFTIDATTGAIAAATLALTGGLAVWNGVDFILYSDAGTTPTALWDSASGKINQAEQSTPATPASGYATIYPNSTGRYEAIDDNGDVWSLGHCQTVKKASDQTIATTTLTDVSEMSFVLRANTDYFFEYHLVHQSAASTTGLKLALVTGAATLNYLHYQTEILATNTANGTDNVQIQNFVASGGTHTTTDQAAATTNSMAVIRGVASVSGTGGTMRPQFAGDAAANITMKQGSYGRLWV